MAPNLANGGRFVEVKESNRISAFLCLKGPWYLRRRGETDRVSSRRGAESRQAHLCQTSEDQVSVWNQTDEGKLTRLKVDTHTFWDRLF